MSVPGSSPRFGLDSSYDHSFEAHRVREKVRASAVLVLVMVVLAGCTKPAESPSSPSKSSPPGTTSSPPTPTVNVVGAPIAKRDLGVRVALEDDWVRPGELLNASVNVPSAVEVTWYLASRNPAEADSPIPVLRPGTVSPGGRSADVDIAQAGRYVLALAGDPNVRVNVTVVQEAASRVEIVLTRDAAGAGVRFAPSEIALGRGSILVVRSEIEEAASIRQVDYLLPIGSGARLSVPAQRDQGDYELRVVARDSTDAWGEAGAKLIIDARKPNPSTTLGPFTGEFSPGDLPSAGGKPKSHAFASKFAFSSLNFTLTTTSQAPGDRAVVLRVKGANGTVVMSSSMSSGAWNAGALPAGSYSLEVEMSAGVVVDYSVMGEGRVVLVTPASFFGS